MAHDRALLDPIGPRSAGACLRAEARDAGRHEEAEVARAAGGVSARGGLRAALEVRGRRKHHESLATGRELLADCTAVGAAARTAAAAARRAAAAARCAAPAR